RISPAREVLDKISIDPVSGDYVDCGYQLPNRDACCSILCVSFGAGEFVVERLVCTHPRIGFGKVYDQIESPAHRKLDAFLIYEDSAIVDQDDTVIETESLRLRTLLRRHAPFCTGRSSASKYFLPTLF